LWQTPTQAKLGARMAAGRVILVQLPQLLREIVSRALLHTPDIDIVAEYEDLDQVARLCPFEAIEVIVAGVDRPADTSRLEDILASHPRLRAVALTESGRHGAVWECVPHETPLGELSTDCFVEAVRHACRRTGCPGKAGS
jgi:DNA-binding NarL/FixJ family response regulator